MKGTVEQVWKNESRNGQAYLTVQITERYSVWDDKYFDRFEQGTEVEYDFRQSGNFSNITEVNGITGEDAGQEQPMYHNDRDLRITRLSCLKSAAGIIAPALMEPDAKRDLVIDTARVLNDTSVKTTSALCRQPLKVNPVQGTVDSIRRDERTNGSEYWVLSIDGERYSAWDSDLVQGVEPGHQVAFAFTSSGRFRNLTALKRLAPANPSTAAPGVIPESLRIVRMNCLRTAAEIVQATTLLPEQKLTMSIAFARRLEQHVVGLSADHTEPAKADQQSRQTQRGEKNGR